MHLGNLDRDSHHNWHLTILQAGSQVYFIFGSGWISTLIARLDLSQYFGEKKCKDGSQRPTFSLAVQCNTFMVVDKSVDSQVLEEVVSYAHYYSWQKTDCVSDLHPLYFQTVVPSAVDKQEIKLVWNSKNNIWKKTTALSPF